ncbi:MAG: hypothetical protein Q9217_004608 [Psora testacea]
MRPEKRWAPIKDQLRSVIKDKPADPAEINFWRGSAEQGVACCRIKNPRHGQEAFEKIQGYPWKEKRLRAWLLEKDPADGKMYYLGGPQDPRTGQEEPVPVDGPVPLSPRMARRGHHMQPASPPNSISHAQTPRDSVSRQRPMPSPAFGVQHASATSRNARRGPSVNASANKITVQPLDPKSGTKDLRLCFERDLHLAKGDFTIKPGKNNMGKLHASVTFSTAEQADYAVRKLDGTKIGNSSVNAVLDNQAQRTGRNNRSGSSKESPSHSDVVLKQESMGEPTIIDGSVSD